MASPARLNIGPPPHGLRTRTREIDTLLAAETVAKTSAPFWRRQLPPAAVASLVVLSKAAHYTAACFGGVLDQRLEKLLDGFSVPASGLLPSPNMSAMIDIVRPARVLPTLDHVLVREPVRRDQSQRALASDAVVIDKAPRQCETDTEYWVYSTSRHFSPPSSSHHWRPARI